MGASFRKQTFGKKRSMNLSELKTDRQATILSVGGDDKLAMRLMEMGITENEKISFLGAAPLGDPLEFEIRGYRISLRKNEASRICIEVD